MPIDPSLFGEETDHRLRDGTRRMASLPRMPRAARRSEWQAKLKLPDSGRAAIQSTGAGMQLGGSLPASAMVPVAIQALVSTDLIGGFSFPHPQARCYLPIPVGKQG